MAEKNKYIKAIEKALTEKNKKTMDDAIYELDSHLMDVGESFPEDIFDDLIKIISKDDFIKWKGGGYLLTVFF